MMDLFGKLFAYENLDDNTKKLIQLKEYGFSFLEKICNLYNIECEKMECKSSDILKYLFVNGHVGFCVIDDKLCCGRGTYTDGNGSKLNRMGRLTHYTITFENGETYEGEIGKDIVVVWWNNMHHGQSAFLNWYLRMLTENDNSMEYNIFYTRVCPIPIVDTDVEEKSMIEVLKNLFNGEKKIFKRQQKSLLSNENLTENKLDLTNPSASAYMQNLSRFHDELILRICLEFGVYVSSRDKGAQMNNRELSAFADYCAISSDDTYNQLLEGAKEIKKVFGIDMAITPKAFVYTEKDVVADEGADEGANEGANEGADEGTDEGAEKGEEA